MNSRVNILPVIAEYIGSHDMHCESNSREYIFNWLTGQLPHSYSSPFQAGTVEAEIAADCLIAAGCGEEAAQHATVFGFYSYDVADRVEGFSYP